MNFPWIPWQVRERVHGALAWPARQRLRRGRRAIRRASSGAVRMGLGGALSDGRSVHGGAVKLLPLRAAFGDDDAEFNVLYAVSSSPPRFCDDLFRVCRKAGIPVVWNQNGVGYPAWSGRESERLNAPMRRRREQAAFVVYQSDFCRRSAERFLGPSRPAASVLYNPVDLRVYAPGPGREEKGPPRLLAAGTHATRERVIAPLEALAALRRDGLEATLTIAGRFDWPEGEAEIGRAVEAAGLIGVVRRVERFSQADAADLYRAHDLLVHPKYMDPCPTVVVEALACGLPVVGSRSGGLPEMVPEDAGILVGAGDDWDRAHPPSGAEIAGAVAALLPRLGPASTAARSHAERHFDVGRWVDEHRMIFERVLS